MQMQPKAQWEGQSLIGNTFRVEWQRRHDVAMMTCNHLKNPWNDNQPVRIARDGQEMPSDIGEQIVDAIESSAKANGVMGPREHLHLPFASPFFLLPPLPSFRKTIANCDQLSTWLGPMTICL